MATLKAVLEGVYKNPGTDKTKQIYQMIYSGQFDNIAQKEGIDLSPIKALNKQTPTSPATPVSTEKVGSPGSQFPSPFSKEGMQNAGNAIGGAKAFVGGVAQGATGVALTAEDYLGRKIVNQFGTEQMKQNVANAPSLQEQFKQQMGGNEHPTAYGVGTAVGEIGSLAAPIGAAENIIGKGAEALGAGKTLTTLVKGATGGAAYTAGHALQSGEMPTVKDFAVNSALGLAFPVAGIALKGLAENVAPKIVNSLIKPLAKDFSYGKNPGKTVADLGITGNSYEDLANNISAKLQEVGKNIGTFVSQSTGLRQLDLNSTMKSLDEAIIKANKTPQTNSSLIQRLESVKSDLQQNINGGIDPQSFKGLVGDLTKWTGSVTDDQAVNKALKQVYGSTVGEMDKVMSKELTPEQFAQYKNSTAQYGDLLSAKNATIYRDKLVQRQDLISFGAKNAGLITALTTAIATGGAALPAILAGIAGVGVDKAMASPAFKTRLASLLSKLAPAEVTTLTEKIPGLKAIIGESPHPLSNPTVGETVSGLNEKDNSIISSVKNLGKYLIKRISNKDVQEINNMGIHQISKDSPIIYDKGALTHYEKTLNLPNKSRRLTPSESEKVVSNPDDVLPNFIRGDGNSYLYVKKLPNHSVSIVEVIDDGKNLRITHGGFETRESYLKGERELKKSILEGRQNPSLLNSDKIR